jgi:hypothetical protein
MSWESSGNDATNYAAVRWYALVLEQHAIAILGSDRTRFNDVRSILAQALDSLQGMENGITVAAVQSCPPGWVLCGGLCAPDC